MRKSLASLIALVLASGAAYAATIPTFTGPSGSNPANLPIAQPDLNTLVTNANISIATQAGPLNFRNVLDNGDMAVQQRGTTAATGGTTSTASVYPGPDRWAVDTNVTSGAGYGAAVASGGTPSLPNYMKLYRNSGALTQPVCTIQEVPATSATQLAGQSVVFSAYMQDLGGLTADNGGSVQVYVITGTTADQGLGTLTASPAITPAWAGLASSAAQSFTVTSAWARFSTTPIALPTGIKEVGVEICFTPTATGAGATDGIGITGAQLELNAYGVSPFENLPYPVDFQRAQVNGAYVLKEPASGAAVAGVCMATGANTNACTFTPPYPFRATTPTITITTAGTFKVNIAGTATTIATPTASTCSSYGCAVTAANTNTAGQAEVVTGGGGTGSWIMSGDF